jgi:XTP/dITP diphosphohydrolase
MARLVLATRNRGKIEELVRLMDDPSLEIHTADDYPDGPEVDETARTLAGNALLKARAWHEYTGLPAIADDTGLEVETLGGEPGVLSARYAGPACDAGENRERLLTKMRGLTGSDRRARFRTVMAFVGADEKTFEGVCTGVITDSEAGSGGFGYDCIFKPDGSDRTFAEMTTAEKNELSHRAKAVAKAAEFLRSQDRLYR